MKCEIERSWFVTLGLHHFTFISVHMSSLVRALGVCQRMADEQPVTLLGKTCCGPYRGIWTRQFCFGQEVKTQSAGKVPEVSKKKVRKKLTLNLPRSEGTVRFDEIVLVKVGDKQNMVLLKGYSSPNSTSAFYKKRRLQILNMHLKHLNRAMTPRRLKIQKYVHDT